MTIESDARELGKWLNEEPNRPLDRPALARVLHELERLRAQVAEWEKLREPDTLHANLLRGLPAQLTIEQLRHLLGTDVAPAGWKLVPVEATQEMLAAEVETDAFIGIDDARKLWDAMVAASPAAPAQQAAQAPAPAPDEQFEAWRVRLWELIDAYRKGHDWPLACRDRLKSHIGRCPHPSPAVEAETKGWVCKQCGIDRCKAACPLGHSAALTGKCPMVGIAQSDVPVQPKEPTHD